MYQAPRIRVSLACVNVVLLDAADFVSETRATVNDERSAHLHDILKVSVGDSVIVGRVGGKLGHGTVVGLSEGEVELEIAFDQEPPAPLPLHLACALCRPPTLRKVLQQATALGVKKVALFHTARVEKSYWDSKQLAPEALRKQLLLGLQQARDTVLPQIELHRRFRPFVEDRLRHFAQGGEVLLADLDAPIACPSSLAEPATIVIGPEGGLIPFEIDLLEAAGARRVSLGTRPLRVETAVVAMLGRLAPSATRSS
jgi:RsmE family RNA methyltransferase